MSIYEFLNENSALNVTINAGQLTEIVDYAISKAKAEFEAQQKTEIFLTRQETATKCKVNLTTLFRWSRSGYLCPVKVGKRVMYSQSSIDKILQKGADA